MDILKRGKPPRPAGGGESKLEKVMARLRVLAQRQAAAPPGQNVAVQQKMETVADDGPLPADRQQVIAASEALVRPALAMFGVDYDALIKMDGKSPYAMAVQARPDVLQQVLESDNPVLAALQVATGYQPYAAFAEKYGREPDEIKARIKAEVLTEDAGADGAAVEAPVFSRPYGGEKKVAPREPAHEPARGLGAVFGR